MNKQLSMSRRRLLIRSLFAAEKIYGMFGLTFEIITFKRKPFREIIFGRNICVWFEYFKSKFKRSVFVWIK